MVTKTLLTFIDKSGDVAALKPLIDWVQKNDWHLSVQVIGIASPSPLYVYGVSPYGGMVIPDDWSKQLEAEAQEVSTKVDEVQNALQREGVSANVINSYCEKYSLEDCVSEVAKVSDLAVLPGTDQFDPDTVSRIVGGLLFRSPIGVVVNTGDPSKALAPKRVFVAWDSSLQASRAVHQALPLLTTAEEVFVGLFDPVIAESISGEEPGADVCQWLSRQGCKVTLQQYPSGGREVGSAIQKRAFEAGADLVVMGAFGHTRMRQRIFGGTTQMMLEQKSQPVFLVH